MIWLAGPNHHHHQAFLSLIDINKNFLRCKQVLGGFEIHPTQIWLTLFPTKSFLNEFRVRFDLFDGVRQE